MAKSFEARKAYRLNKKVRSGKDLSSDERAFLDSYTPAPRGPKPGSRARTDDAAPGAPADAPVVDDGPDVAPEFRVETEVPAPETPTVKPRAQDRAGGAGKGKARAGGDWRAKYREGAADGEREATCIQLAMLWAGGLTKMNESIVRNGGTPAFPDYMIAETSPGGITALGPIGKCLVLSVDKLLPADLTIGPELEAAAVSSVITTQAWWVSRRAKLKRDTRTAAERAAAAWVNPAPPKVEPDPEPEPERSGGNGTSKVVPLVPVPAEPYHLDDNTRF